MDQDTVTTLAAIAAVIAAGAAVGQLAVIIVAAKFAKRQVDEARTLREDQARPFVVVDFDVRDHLIYLSVSNLGNTMARNVSIAFEPPLRSTFDTRDGLTSPADLKMFADGIPNLPPRKAMETLFDNFPARNEGPFDDAYTVALAYTGDDGREYADTLLLDLGLYRNRLSAHRDGVHQIHARLKEIKDEMHRWTAGWEGLLVLSPEERRRRNEELLARDEERERAELAAADAFDEEVR